MRLKDTFISNISCFSTDFSELKKLGMLLLLIFGWGNGEGFWQCIPPISCNITGSEIFTVPIGADSAEESMILNSFLGLCGNPVFTRNVEDTLASYNGGADGNAQNDNSIGGGGSIAVNSANGNRARKHQIQKTAAYDF